LFSLQFGYIHTGVDFFDIPPIDPLEIESMSADHSQGSSFNLKSALKNSLVKGVSDAVVTRVATKFDKKFQMKIEININRLEIAGDYTMEGKLLVLPIRGNGKANLTLTGMKGQVMIKGSYVERDGQQFIDIENFKITLVEHLQITINSNLF
jgi:archaellum component FlaG (FlaF/FlaG flagellin family)